MNINFAYISIVLAFLTGVGLSGIYFSSLEPEVTINRTEGDIHQTHNIEPPKYNYIQSNNHKVNYSWTSGEVTVEDVDKIIDLNGLSMRPTFFTGHKALATKYEDNGLEEGSIVSANGVVHRIVGDYTDTSGEYSTRGDNNEHAERVNQSDIDYVIIGSLYSENN